MMAPVELPWSEREPLLAALEALAPGEGQAEHEPNDAGALLRFFLPTPSFRRALDPNVMLIAGEKGAGKTELFRVLGTEHGFAALGVTARPGETLKLVAGFGRVLSQQTDQPSAASLENMMGKGDEAGWRGFWLGMLAARLLKSGEALEIPDSVSNALGSPSRVDMWLAEVLRHFDAIIAALDHLDAQLLQGGRAITIAYDELDRVAMSYPGLFPPIRVLLSLWLDWWRRWERLRPKIILRDDLLESRLLAFPDASKLKAHRVDLQWQRIWLYQMAIKRILNGPPGLAQLARRAAEAEGRRLDARQDPLLGAVPALDEDAFAAVVAALVGPYMGADPRKGYSYWWIPSHVADARGRALPRPFLQLISLAARSARERAASSEREVGRLLLPSDFFRAMNDTSELRLKELAEQRPWLAPLRDACDGGKVPMDREELLSRLGSIRWPEADEIGAPPTTDAERLLDEYLVPLGLFEARPDRRLNVPDIFRHGLGLGRKGGIGRRPV